MIRPICKDIEFLAQKAEPATLEDLPVGEDLLDTFKAMPALICKPFGRSEQAHYRL